MSQSDLIQYFASSATSLLIGLVCAGLLILKGGHLNEKNHFDSGRLVTAANLGAATYTSLILFAGHFFVGVKVSRIVAEGFGDERIAWICVALFFDFMSRLRNIYFK